MEYFVFPGQFSLYRKRPLKKHSYDRLEFDGDWYFAVNLSSHAVPITLDEFLEGRWRFWFREHWNAEGNLLVEDYYKIVIQYLT